MDLPLLFRVVWRFRLLFALGVFLAVTLSLLSYVRVDASDGFNVSYRDQEQWESLSTLFITSTGFPWGSVSDQAQTPSGADEDRAASGVDAGRLTTLAGLYMQLATSDPVMQLMRRDGPIDGQLQTFPVFSTNNSDGSQLPMVTFSAITASPESAMRLAQRHVRAFMTFIEREQVNSAIPADNRVRVQVVRKSQAATLLVPRKKTRPIIVFVAVMSAVFGLIIALENMRPRLRRVSGNDAASGRRAA